MVQAMHMLLCHSGMQEHGIGQGAGAMLACYIAAAMHDFEHGGLTNDYLVSTCLRCIRSVHHEWVCRLA